MVNKEYWRSRLSNVIEVIQSNQSFILAVEEGLNGLVEYLMGNNPVCSLRGMITVPENIVCCIFTSVGRPFVTKFSNLYDPCTTAPSVYNFKSCMHALYFSQEIDY